MFLKRRNLIIVGAVLLILVVAAIAAGALKKNTADPYKVACDGLINAIAHYDYSGGYALLSTKNKQYDDVASWGEKTSVLGNVYKDAQVTLTDQQEVKAEGDTDSPASLKVLFTYTIVHPAMTSQVLCRSTQEDGKYVVDDFRSYNANTQTDGSSEGASQ